jgi:radical SAM superfamily enzyme YgiQ (UPF0313 family)
VVAEAKQITEMPDFKGYIHDVGGPTANFRYPACKKQLEHGVCANRKCLAPKPCPNLIADHSEYIELLKAIEALPKVKKVFIRSGIRFDYLLADPKDDFFRKLVRDHVSGQLKVAPEHCASPVLRCMGKPDFHVYETFRKKYFELSEACGKEQYLVPYLMSSHPGSTLNEAIDLALCLKRDHYAPEQVQDYYPTPGTASTVMFYTGINPMDMKPVHVVTDYHEKQLQRALLQFNRPENADLVREALTKAGRTDLIGFGPECLVKPAGGRPAPHGAAPHGGKPASKKGEGDRKGGKTDTKGGYASKNGHAASKGGKAAAPTAKGGARPTAKPAAKGGSTPQKGGKPAPKSGKGRR